MSGALSEQLERFLHGDLDPAEFHHADHVRTTFEILQRHDFLDAAQALCAGLKVLARKSGRPSAYHETITLAFLSLIAERMAATPFADFDSFAAANADLMKKTALDPWYAKERLNSELARRLFVLPVPRSTP